MDHDVGTVGEEVLALSPPRPALMKRVGVRFSVVDDSTMTTCASPVTLSVSSRRFSPSTMSLTLTLPPISVSTAEASGFRLDERLAVVEVDRPAGQISGVRGQRLKTQSRAIASQS